MNAKRWQWLENVLVVSDGTLMTVLPRGVVEVRGRGWEPRRGSRARRRGEDCRTLKLGSVRTARRICERIAELISRPKNS